MARILVALRTAVVAVGAVAILSSGVAAQDTAHVCLQYGMSGAGSVYYDITTAPSGTVMKRYNMAANPPALVDTNGFAALHKPANNGDYWSEGIDFVAAMQSRQVWINQDPNQPAYWQRDTNTGEDTWLFTTTISGSPITLTFRTSQCTMGSGETTTAAPPPANNCPAAAQQPGVNCGAGTDCCGYGTMNPHCVAQGTGDHCCVWYLSSKTCNSTQTCCGMMGPGASSYAYCCDAGSTCCTASTGYSGTSTCCPTGSTCCQGSTVGLCCGPTEECVPNENRCRAAGAGETTTTNAPTVPATPPPVSVDSAHVCLQYGSVYYDITTNPSQTLMKRYNMAVNPPAFMDTNDFAALHKPANNGDYWSEGIDFVAAMQSRLVWINQEPNQPAYWEYNSATGESTWRFTTTISGSQVELTFRSSQCNM